MAKASAMANHFVKDPHTLVNAGEVVKVKVLAVDLERRRIALSMRLEDRAEEQKAETAGARNKPVRKPAKRRDGPARNERPAAGGGAMADALAEALKSTDR